MLNLAIVGLGRWGKNFVESVQFKSERVRFVRGVDKAPDKLREFAAKHDLPLVTDLSEVLNDPAIKGIVVVTPHSLHRPMVEAIAAAGKHVFCEKPLALNTRDAQAMIDACRNAGVTLGVGHNRRLWPSMLKLKEIVDSGELGQILHIEGHFSNQHSDNTAGTWRDSPQESPGGGLTGAGLHILDAFLNVIGPFKRVQGQLLVMKPPPVPRDVAACLVEFQNGVSGVMATVRASPFYWRIHVFGDKGSVESIDENELLLYRATGKPVRNAESVKLDPAVNALLTELEVFAKCIEEGKPFTVPAEDMLLTVSAFEAVVKTLETGQPVELAS